MPAHAWRDGDGGCVEGKRTPKRKRSGRLNADDGSRLEIEGIDPRGRYLIDAEDREIADPDVMRECLERLGLSGAALIADAQSEAGKASLRATVEQAQATGLFGAPSFVVAGEVFWGNDRLEDALDWAARDR